MTIQWLHDEQPATNPQARKARDELAELFPHPIAAMTLARLAGLSIGAAHLSGNSVQIWTDLIMKTGPGIEARNQLLVRAVGACPTEGARRGLIEAIGGDPRETLPHE